MLLGTDIKLYQSTNRLGGAITETEIVDATVGNLFDNVSGSEAGDGDTEFRAFYVKNTNPTIAWQEVQFWIGSNTTSVDDTLTVGLDLAGVISTGAGDSIPDESTAPDPAVTFVAAANEVAALSIGNMTPGAYILIWVKRIVSSSAAVILANAATLNWTGDPEA